MLCHNHRMKRIFLIRHAKSGWKNPGLKDFDRPLSKHGKKNAPEMGRCLAQYSLLPDLFISSPARRAIETAQVIAKAIGFSVEKIIPNSKVYEARVPELLEILKETDVSHKTVLLIGHNPSLTDFINSICNYSLDNLPQGGIFCVDFRSLSWKEIDQQTGRVIFVYFPTQSAAEED